MSSKKYRKKLKNCYNKFRDKPENIRKASKEKELPDITTTVSSILGKIKNFFVIFPEIKSSPIKLGQLFQATIKIGKDEAQERRLLYATIVMPMEKSNQTIDELARLSINEKEKVITAPVANSKFSVSPVLKVLYPLPLGGFAMHPIAIFDWYGKEDIIISNIEECTSEISDKIVTPNYQNVDMIWSGNYIGRELDGVEIFEEVMI